MDRTRLNCVNILSLLIVAISLICCSEDGKEKKKDLTDMDSFRDDDDYFSSGEADTESPITVSSESVHVQYQPNSPKVPNDSKKIYPNLNSGIIPIDHTKTFTGSIQTGGENDKSKQTDDKAFHEQGKSTILSVPWPNVEEEPLSKIFMLAGTIAITVLMALSILWISFCVVFTLVEMKDCGKSKKKPDKNSDISLDYEVCVPVDNLSYENVDAKAFEYEEVLVIADSRSNKVFQPDIEHSVEQKMSRDTTKNTNLQTELPVDNCWVINQQMTEEATADTTTVESPIDVTSVNTAQEYPPVEVKSANRAPVDPPVHVTSVNTAPVDPPVDATSVNTAPVDPPVDATSVNATPVDPPVDATSVNAAPVDPPVV